MIKVIVERGDKRVFASAAEWPGYARSGRTEADALAALAAYGPRYAKVVKRIATFREPRAVSEFDVVHRVGGGSGTDFGAPSSPAKADDAPVTAADLKKLTGILEACWSAFDRAARAAAGKTLATGPRGGGRTVEKMAAHVLEAEVMYLSALGSRAPKSTGPRRSGDVRAAALAAFSARSRGLAVADPSKTTKHWTPRYYARRSAWHALDHAWELEDRVIS